MATETISSSHQLPSSPQDEPLSPNLTALSTISLLNLRLSRLEFLLTGKTEQQQYGLHSDCSQTSPYKGTSTSNNIPSQLRTLGTRLANLKRLDGLPGSLVRMVDTLRSEYPEIFSNTSQQLSFGGTTSSDQHVSPPAHILSHHANEALSHSTLYTSTSSRLQTLQTLRIPPASQSANLINAAPRLDLLKKRQKELESEIEELRGRSANVLEWWMKNGVVGMGELWEDWEDRISVCERGVRREERRAREENGEVG